jgi:hypothetical protein
MKRLQIRWLALTCLALMAVPRLAAAQTDEIQVYDGALAAVGVFNLTWHNNYIANGLMGQPFPGAVAANKSWNGVPEWAYGVTPWFEAGLYLPLYSHDDTMGWGLNGFKLRTLFAVPHADDREFFYGANFEFSDNAKRWDTRKFTSEIRPIIGWHLKPLDIIINPIVDTKYEGGVKALEFVPSERLAYNFEGGWALAGEEYADFGPLGHLQSLGNQVHQIFAVVDRTGGALNVEAGVGFGLTGVTDKLTFKLILSRDLNHKE